MKHRTEILFLIAVLTAALFLRIVGNGWGIVRTVPEGPAGFGADSSGPFAGTIAGSYVYDEEMFALGLGFFSRWVPFVPDSLSVSEPPLARQREHRTRALNSLGSLTSTPSAPLLYSAWAVLISGAGSLFGSGDLSMETALQTYYRTGRYLTALISILLCLIIFRVLVITLENDRNKPLLAAGFLLICFQPALVLNSHWITYNPLTALAEFFAFWLFIRQLDKNQEARGHLPVWPWVIAGLAAGFCISIKFTSIALPAVCAGWLGFSAIRKSAANGSWKGLLKCDDTRRAFFFASGTAAGYLLLILPFFFGDELSGSLGVMHSMTGSVYLPASRLSLVFQYFFKTLPAGLGWPVTLAGAAGIALTLFRRGGIPRIRILLILWSGIYIWAFTTNGLGIMVQRSLTVYCLWTIFALWCLEFLYHRSRLLAAAAGIYLICGNVSASLIADYYLIKDTPGYRTEASEYILNHLPPGADLVFAVQDKHFLIDLAMAENALSLNHTHGPLRSQSGENRKLQPGRYRYHFLLPEHLDQFDLKGFAVYPPGQTALAPAIAVFESALKKEPLPLKRTRQLFGFHRFDQIVLAPSFGIYQIP